MCHLCTDLSDNGGTLVLTISTFQGEKGTFGIRNKVVRLHDGTLQPHFDLFSFCLIFTNSVFVGFRPRARTIRTILSRTCPDLLATRPCVFRTASQTHSPAARPASSHAASSRGGSTRACTSAQALPRRHNRSFDLKPPAAT